MKKIVNTNTKAYKSCKYKEIKRRKLYVKDFKVLFKKNRFLHIQRVMLGRQCGCNSAGKGSSRQGELY